MLEQKQQQLSSSLNGIIQTQTLNTMEQHKWVKDKCIKCGLSREKFTGVFVYSRSGIIKIKPSHFECIDWYKENKKTID